MKIVVNISHTVYYYEKVDFKCVFLAYYLYRFNVKLGNHHGDLIFSILLPHFSSGDTKKKMLLNK